MWHNANAVTKVFIGLFFYYDNFDDVKQLIKKRMQNKLLLCIEKSSPFIV
jgi:hypothetical protein